MEMNRRNAMKMGLFGAGATAAGLALPLGESASTADWISTSARPGRFQRQLPVPQPITPQMLTDDYGDFLHYDITERAGFAQILDTNAPKTPILGYAAGNGAPTVPGPLIKVDVNTRVRLRVKNALPTKHPTFGFEGGETSVHLHGSASLPQYDGYADDLTPPGYYKDYWYSNAQGMRTLWYHDHRAHHTAENAYSGLAAQYHIQTPWEKENLPQGRYDVPLTVTDAMFARDGKLAYMDRDHSGLFGDVILVNAVPWPWLKVERRFYRFRVLVATLSRSFTFSLVNLRTGATLPVHVVATDGGPMVPQQVTSWRHSTAERYEIMVDFAGCRLGDVVEMRNASNRNNVNYLHTGKVMQFRVAANATENRWNTVVTPPASELSPLMDKTEDGSMRRRDIDLKHDDVTNEFSLNEMTWEDIRDANWNIFTDDGHGHPKVGDYEVWRIENDSGGWFHPMHIHLVDFKILSRSGGAGKVQPWERGPKDVVYVGEGERIELLVHYVMPKPHYPDGRSTGLAGATGYLGGRYMIHCHNLPHEDHDMMGQFLVAASDGTVDLSTSHPNHPITAAPAQQG
jgi:FtsP/CotA-like multicopper oxidase with cupredoxin domain